MKTIFFALALAVPAFADVITYTQSASFTPTANLSLNESGVIEIPRFDPSLGALNSVAYAFGILGTTTFQMSYRPSKSQFTYDVDSVSYSFLGQSYHFSNDTSGPGYVGDPYLLTDIPCGPNEALVTPFGNFPNPCPDTIIPIDHGANTEQFHTDPAHGSGGLVANPDLGAYVGIDPMVLAWSVAINVASPELYNGPGIIFGDHLLEGNFFASYTYDYTPAPAEVTATPEPRLAGLFLIAAFAAAARLRSRIGHVGALEATHSAE